MVHPKPATKRQLLSRCWRRDPRCSGRQHPGRRALVRRQAGRLLRRVERRLRLLQPCGLRMQLRAHGCLRGLRLQLAPLQLQALAEYLVARRLRAAARPTSLRSSCQKKDQGC